MSLGHSPLTIYSDYSKFVSGTALTSSELVEWANAPFACGRCLAPFLRWSACEAHIFSSRTFYLLRIFLSERCLKSLEASGQSVRAFCEDAADKHRGKLRAAPPVMVVPKKRPSRHIFRPEQDINRLSDIGNGLTVI